VSYLLYNILITAAFIAALPFLPIVAVLGQRFRAGLTQRLGFYSKGAVNSLAGCRPVWIHGASVGEVGSALLLIRELKQRFPAKKIILSTFTSSGNRIARAAGAADLVLFLPLDLLWIVRRALARFDPSLLLIVETEIWPNLIREAHRRGIPTLLLSGRLSARSYREYSFVAAFFRRVIGYFTAIGMQSAEDGERIVELGAPAGNVSIVGSLKHAAARADGTGTQHGGLHGPRANPLLVVGSSHRGEEAIFIEAFVYLKQRFPGLQMALAPRHPERFAEVEKLLQRSGLSFEKQSEIDGRAQFTKDVMFLDTLGDLKDFYALGDIAFVGGSLVEAGGHNLLEPARQGKPILFGPHISNFSSIAAEFKRKGGAIEVRGKEELIHEITTLLYDSARRKVMGERAYEIANDDRRVLERNLTLAERYLQ